MRRGPGMAVAHRLPRSGMKPPPNEPAGAQGPATPRAPRGVKSPANVGKAPIAPDDPQPGAGQDLPMPNERDESIGNTAAHTDPVIEQAQRDIESGQVDTDLRNTPGLDAPRRAELLKRERERGA